MILNRFQQFYPTYKLAHQNPINKKLHFFGSSLLIICVALAGVFHIYLLTLIGCFEAYLVAHIGHKYFERNKSMRASHPVFCVLGAGVYYLEMLINLFRKGKL